MVATLGGRSGDGYRCRSCGGGSNKSGPLLGSSSVFRQFQQLPRPETFWFPQTGQYTTFNGEALATLGARPPSSDAVSKSLPTFGEDLKASSSCKSCSILSSFSAMTLSACCLMCSVLNSVACCDACMCIAACSRTRCTSLFACSATCVACSIARACACAESCAMIRSLWACSAKFCCLSTSCWASRVTCDTLCWASDDIASCCCCMEVWYCCWSCCVYCCLSTDTCMATFSLSALT